MKAASQICVRDFSLTRHSGNFWREDVCGDFISASLNIKTPYSGSLYGVFCADRQCACSRFWRNGGKGPRGRRCRLCIRVYDFRKD